MNPVHKSLKKSLARAEEFIQKGLELHDSLGLAHAFLGSIYKVKRQLDKALVEGEHAVSLNPNSGNIVGLAVILMLTGRFDEAIAMFKKAIRLDPILPGWMLA